MAAEDVAVSSFLCWKIIPYAFLAILLLLLVRYGGDLHKRLLAKFVSFCCLGKIAENLKPHKDRLFEDLADFESRDWKLRNQGLIRILEIGPGPGVNFDYYPKNCQLVCYDNNPHMKQYLFEHHALFPHVNLERFVVSGGEDLVGTEDGSVDVVVSTLVNCSVSDVDVVMKEILRVLAPGGKYFFIDHVIAPEGTSCYRNQKTIRSFFRKIMDCDVHRDIGAHIKKAGFSDVQVEDFEMIMGFPFGLFIRNFIKGSATK